MKDRRTYADWSSLLALAGLLLFLLACIYPVAWSPDSEKLVFPLFGDKGIHGLMMTDRKGVEIRLVAEIDPTQGCLSPASWSPNGKHIAYIRYSRPLLSEASDAGIPAVTSPFVLNLFVQDAKTGSEQCIYSCGFHRQEVNPIDYYPPEWTGNSRSLAVFEIEEETPVLTVLDRKGKVRARTKLPKALLEVGAAVSPNGRHVAFVTRSEDPENRGLDIRTMDIKKRRSKMVATVRGLSKADESYYCRPAWCPDSRALYYAALEEDGEASRCQLMRYSLRSGESEIVWEKTGASLYRIAPSSKSDVIALDCMLPGDSMSIEILDLSTGRSNSFYSAYHYSTAVSPDGKWVAFCPGSKSLSGCCILSKQGDEGYVFFPSQLREEQVEGLVESVALLSIELAFRSRGKDFTIEEMERLFPDELSFYQSEWMDAYVEAAAKIVGNRDHPAARISLLSVKAQQLLGQLIKSEGSSRNEIAAKLWSVIDEIRAIPIGETAARKMEKKLQKVLEKISSPVEETP